MNSSGEEHNFLLQFGYNRCYSPTVSILAKDLLEKLRVQKGCLLYVTETPDGIRISPYDPAFAAQMELAARVMREDRDALRKLAE